MNNMYFFSAAKVSVPAMNITFFFSSHPLVRVPVFIVADGLVLVTHAMNFVVASVVTKSYLFIFYIMMDCPSQVDI